MYYFETDELFKSNPMFIKGKAYKVQATNEYYKGNVFYKLVQEKGTFWRMDRVNLEKYFRRFT